MPVDSRPVVDIAAEAARTTHCEYTAFNQTTNLLQGWKDQGLLGNNDFGANGICYGLAVAWLERHKAGRADSFLTDAQNWEGSAVATRSHLIYRNQKNIKLWESLTGLRRAMDGGQAKERVYPLGATQMGQAAAWIASAYGQRYFLLHVKKHSMAAVGSSRGTLEFFDPNCGVVRAPNVAALGNFFFAYFSNSKVRASYMTPNPNEFLTLEKFKAA